MARTKKPPRSGNLALTGSALPGYGGITATFESFDEASEFSIEQFSKVKRMLIMGHGEPTRDRLYYMANEAEIGNWELVCLLKLNRVEIIRLRPIPLRRTRRRR